MTIFCCQETKSCFSWAEYASLERQRSSRPENMDIVLGSVEGASSRLEHTFLETQLFTLQQKLMFAPERRHDESHYGRSIRYPRHL